MKEAQTLSRSLGSLQIQLISLGGIIGSAYFLGIGSTVALLGPSIVPAFMLGGAIVWMVALAMGELCVELPREGSFVSFAKELVSSPWAAGVGWSYWFNWCAYIACEMIAGGIIMHGFVPAVPAMAWTVGFGILITSINLLNVAAFGAIESVLAVIKIAAVALFAALGTGVWLGWIGSGDFLGASILTQGRGLDGLFPSGPMAVLLSMVVVLVNFQGTELIALAASEAKNPREAVPLACRQVALRIIGIFVVPLLILVAIFPHRQSTLEESVFSAALASHGFRWVAAFFSFVALTAAFSCANSGLYGNVRALYGLGKEGLAPAAVTRLNAAGVPATATWATIAACWAFLPLFVLFKGTTFYTWLLAVSGFTGAICWLSISWCHLRFRKRRDKTAPAWAYVSVAAQLACLGLIPFSDDFRGCLVIGLPALFVPMAAIWLRERRAAAVPVLGNT